MEARTLRSLCLHLMWISLATPKDVDSPLIRLTGLDERCHGAVQVWMKNSWHSICETSLSSGLSAHICAMQKCGTPILPVSGHEVNVSTPLVNVTCEPMEDIRNCSFSHVAEDECDGAALLHCAEPPVLRLSGGLCAGRVEIFMDGVWGSVCHDGWDALDAEVTCQQMKCGSALSALPTSHYGPPQIHLNDVNCTGGERFLWECPASGRQECSAGEHAGVICAEHRDVRLSGGANNCSGRVEVFLRGVWATVCDNHWFEDDSLMLCKYLGCESFQNQTKHEHSLSTYVAFVCSKAKSLWDCLVYKKKAHICDQSKALGLICQAGAIDDSSVTESKTSDITNITAPGCHHVHVGSQFLVIACAALSALLLVSIFTFSVIVCRLQKQKKISIQNASLPRSNGCWTSRDSKQPAFSLQTSSLCPIPSPRLQNKVPVPASIPLVPCITRTLEDEEGDGYSSAPLMPLVTFQDSFPKQEEKETQQGATAGPCNPNQLRRQHSFPKQEEKETQQGATAGPCNPNQLRRQRSGISEPSSSTSSEEQNWYENYRQQVGHQNLLSPPQPYEGSSEYDDVSSVASD